MTIKKENIFKSGSIHFNILTSLIFINVYADFFEQAPNKAIADLDMESHLLEAPHLQPSAIENAYLFRDLSLQ